MDLIPQLAAVGTVLSLLGFTLWWLKRRGLVAAPGRRSGGRKLACLERLSLSPQHSLHLVRVGNRLLLVSSSPAGCSLVDRVTPGELESGE